MKDRDGGADNSLGPPLGQRPVWGTDGPDYECDCPGPPPRFHLPPPPRPPALPDSDCSDNSISPLETCKAVPVIDSEYRYSPVVPSVTIILAAAVAVVVFLAIGTFLVLLRRRKARNLFPRKALRGRCDGAPANGVVYEDLTNVRGRTLPPGCPPGQTTLPAIEMIDVASFAGQPALPPVLICPAAAVVDPYNSQDLFNPVYEELSNGSGERGESNSEGMPEAAASEDEFAEDELSLGGEGDERWGRAEKSDRSLRAAVAGEVDSSDADDRSKFLRTGRHARDKDRRPSRGPHGSRRARSLDRRKMWRKSPPLPTPPADCSDFSEGFLLRRILQIYPDVTGVTFQYPRGPPALRLSDDLPPNPTHYETLPDFPTPHPPRPHPDIFSTFPHPNPSPKPHQHDSAPGSDSGYSNNTSASRPLPPTPTDYPLPPTSNPVLS